MEAIYWATHWLLRAIWEQQWRGQVVWKRDSTSAGNKASGRANVASEFPFDLASLELRRLQQALEQYLKPWRTSHCHVHAHRGEPGNELVDEVAKAANQRNWEHRPAIKKESITEHPETTKWLWYFLAQQAHSVPLPNFEANKIIWCPNEEGSNRPSPEVCQELKNIILPGLQEQSRGDEIWTTCSLRVATYNALTLGGGRERPLYDEPGRIKLLREQAERQSLHLIGLQETRTKEGMTVSHNYVRFASGSTAEGTHGIELWASRTIPFATTTTGQYYYFKETCFHIAHSTPSLMITTYEEAEFAMTITVAHAPHNGLPTDIKDEWWQKLMQKLKQVHKKGHHVVLIDANARIGTDPSTAFGGKSTDTEDDNGKRLRIFATELGLFAPTTFHEIHQGEDYTWTNPSNTHRSRLDYVLLSDYMKPSTTSSWVEPNFHAGSPDRDHRAVFTDVNWHQLFSGKRKKRQGFDLKAIRKEENRTKLATALEDLPEYDWDMNATEHALRLTKELQRRLGILFPKQAGKEPPQMASPEAQHLYQRLTTARRANRSATKRTRFLWMQVTFRAWKGEQPPDTTHHWHRTFIFEECKAVRDIMYFNHRLKKQLRMDKRDFLEDLATKVNTMKPAEVFEGLRPVLSPAKRGPSYNRPLPMVRKKDGAMTQTRDELDMRWVEHFAELEAGAIKPIDDFIAESFSHQECAIRPTEWQSEDLPELWWIEEAIRKTKNNKATGVDNLPAELLKAAPAISAQVLLPILWKMTMRLEEPLQYKGGILRSLWKQKGSQQDCSNSRSILLIDQIGKVLRSSTRRLANQAYQSSSERMQMAGRQHQTVLFGAQTVRSFAQYCREQKLSTFLVFADVKAAYYQTIRQLACGALETDESVASLVKTLGLPPTVMHELHSALQGASAHDRMGASQAQQALLRQSTTDTWFTYITKELIKTEKGTRPGDSWADVIFNLIANKVLESISNELNDAGLIQTFPEPQTTSPFFTELSLRETPLFHVTWADDITLLLATKHPRHILPALSHATYVLHKALENHGMQLSLGPQKTAAVVTPRGPTATSMKRNLFGKEEASVPVVTEDETLVLPLVHQYRHLGGIVSSHAGLLPELRHRAGKAWGAFRKASKTVFRNRSIDLKVRFRIFQSTVLSIWFWGCGIWHSLNRSEEKYFVTMTWKFYKALWIPPKHDPKATISHLDLQLLLQVPTPLDTLKEARLRHFGLFVRAAPMPTKAITLQDQRMVQALAEAIEWMWDAIGNDFELPHYSEWDEWEFLIIHSPNRWKRLVITAATRHKHYGIQMAKITRWHFRIAELANVDLRRHLRGRSVHFCMVCSKAFLSYQSWFMHAAQLHGYRSPAGLAASGKLCGCCGKCYPTGQALENHLRYSDRCRVFALVYGSVFETNQLGDQHPQMPWIRTGPALDFWADEFDPDQHEVLAALWDAWESVRLSEEPDGQLQEALRLPIPYEKITETFELWQSSLQRQAVSTEEKDLLTRTGTWLELVAENV